MHPPSSLEGEFLKKWMRGLQIYSSTSKNLSILERKKVIKLSADLAMASARNGTTCWSRALIANASVDDKHKNLVEHILGSEYNQKLKKNSIFTSVVSAKRFSSKKILKRSCGIRRVRKCIAQRVLATSIAKKLVKKRTQVLKRLVPGGEMMDGICLIEETLDYIASLRAQVDVMRCLASASKL